MRRHRAVGMMNIRAAFGGNAVLHTSVYVSPAYECAALFCTLEKRKPHRSSRPQLGLPFEAPHRSPASMEHLRRTTRVDPLT